MRINLSLNLFINITCLICVTYLFLFNSFPAKARSLDHDWIEVARTEAGRQWWDRSSLTISKSNVIELNSKYKPKAEQKKTELLYTMEIDCLNKLYRDVSVNNLKVETIWTKTAGDRLIEQVITQSCDIAFN